MIRKKCFIDENIVKKAIEQGKNMGIQEVGFYTNGEPLLNLNIDRYIEYAKKIHIIMCILRLMEYWQMKKELENYLI